MSKALPPFDTYRDTFLRFMEEGMNYAEALEQFDEEKFAHATLSELLNNYARIDVITREFVTNDERKAPALFQLLTRAQFERNSSVDSLDYQQALDLWQAGWTSEVPPPVGGSFWAQVPVMSWAWRRPARRSGQPGRRYPSTNQAWRALQKSIAAAP